MDPLLDGREREAITEAVMAWDRAQRNAGLPSLLDGRDELMRLDPG